MMLICLSKHGVSLLPWQFPSNRKGTMQLRSAVSESSRGQEMDQNFEMFGHNQYWLDRFLEFWPGSRGRSYAGGRAERLEGRQHEHGNHWEPLGTIFQVVTWCCYRFVTKGHQISGFRQLRSWWILEKWLWLQTFAVKTGTWTSCIDIKHSYITSSKNIYVV